MLQLVGALVPLAVAVLSALRWPTLERRIRSHAALVRELKELPDSVTSPLVDLITNEVVDLADRDRKRLDASEDRLLFRLRLGLTGFVVGTYAAVFLTRDFGAEPRGDGPSVWATALWTYAAIIGIVLLWKFTRPLAHRIHRFFDSAGTNPKPRRRQTRDLVVRPPMPPGPGPGPITDGD